MTHMLDIGTDLDDLLGSIGDVTVATTPTPEPAEDQPALISPRLVRAAWYQ